MNFENYITLNINDAPKVVSCQVKVGSKRCTCSIKETQADSKVTDCQDLSDLLNNYFVSVFTREDMSSIPYVQWSGGNGLKFDPSLFSDEVV